MKGLELKSDAPGTVHRRMHSGRRSSCEDTTPARESEKQAFARELGALLEKAAQNQRYGRLVLVAPPGFLGMLRKNMKGETEHLLTDTISKDLTLEKPHELVKHIGRIVEY